MYRPSGYVEKIKTEYSSGKWIFVKWLVSIVFLFLELNIPNASSLCHLTDESEFGQVYGIRRLNVQHACASGSAVP